MGARVTMTFYFFACVFSLAAKSTSFYENFVGDRGELAAVYENCWRAVDVEGLA